MRLQLSAMPTRTLPSGRKANGAKAPGNEESFRPEAVSQRSIGVAFARLCRKVTRRKRSSVGAEGEVIATDRYR